jgi:hypothetical protein
MSGGRDAIFLITADDKIRRVDRSPYENEEKLHTLMRDHPDLILGDQINPREPVRWLLVRLEAGIPDAQDAGDRWALDMLLVDHKGVPTFVETKLSTDTRIRREVVGQMLDYAANAQRYWPPGRLRRLAEEQHGGVEALGTRLAKLLGHDVDASATEEFWRTVEANLSQGRVRLVFAADELPGELLRIIEFLNEHTSEIELFGIELRQYIGDGIRAIVPHVLGMTEQARQMREPSTPGRSLAQEEFLAVLPKSVSQFYDRVLREGKRRGLTTYWGTTSFSLRWQGPDKTYHSLKCLLT